MLDRHFSDEELVAFLDGEEDFASFDAIYDALGQDPELVKRLDALKLDMDALKDSFALLEAPAFDPSMIAAAKAPQAANLPRRPLAGMAVAACLALAVGIGIGSWTAPQPREGWVDYVAAYQALYSEATLDHISQTPEQHTQELQRVASAIGKELTLDQLTSFGDAEYKRAQVLNFNGRPLIQLAFATKDGVPIALCIIKSGNGAVTTAAMKTLELEGLSSAVWKEGGFEYLLIGGTEDDLIERMGQEMQAQAV